jgi:diguanylate cyclase (GGDEF)-like protein
VNAPSDNPSYGAVRVAGVLVLSLALVGAGLAAVVLAGELRVRPPFPVPAWLLLGGYLAAQQFTLGFQTRTGSMLVALVQLPLALGVALVSPLTHLGVRLLATSVDCAWRRRGPLKVAVNLGLASLEVGIAASVLSLLDEGTEAGPSLWVALLVGLLLAGIASQLCLHLTFLVLRLPRTRRDLLEPLTVEVITTTVFAGLAVLTLSSAWTDASTLVVVVALAGVLSASYRAYRRLAAQQRATEELYAFVKVLGPVDVEQPAALAVLEHVRELLHARELRLAVADGGRGVEQCLTVRLDRPPEVTPGRLDAPAEGAYLNPRSMTIPLVVGDSLVGLLCASHRLTSDRGFDMKDLRLLETVATELAIALDRGRLLRDLGRAASTDPMTGLPNLHRVTQGLDALLAEHERVVLAAVAVDSFREVNDTLGHQVGDDLLREVAARLHTAAPGALIGRIGGGRFAVAVPESIAGPDAGLFGLALRSHVEGPAQLGAVGTHVRLAVGCVLAPDHGTDAPTLLRRAETAMYSARLAHGGPVLWEPAYEVQGQRRLAVVMALREALVSGAMGVAFQPKVSAHSGVVTGVEALGRWEHPALGPIGPEEFVPLAEAAGLMGQLTSTVLRQALSACHDWQHVDGQVGVSVNVSADTLQDGGFITEVSSLLRASGVPSRLLTLELTEDVVVADPELAAERMHELQALGVKLSVDDFGTGYSSLTYLKGLPIDEVKIDKGFVAGLVADAGDQAVVRAVVDIAHTLGLSVVAEGVEHEDQLTLLRGMGVDEVQGFLHARPMPFLEMATWLRRRKDVEHLT